MSKIGLCQEYTKEVKEQEVQHYMTKYFFFVVLLALLFCLLMYVIETLHARAMHA